MFPGRETGQGGREDRTDPKAYSGCVGSGWWGTLSFLGTLLLSAPRCQHMELVVRGLSEGAAATVKVRALHWPPTGQTVHTHGLSMVGVT